jgi:hypothetical protein
VNAIIWWMSSDTKSRHTAAAANPHETQTGLIELR